MASAIVREWIDDNGRKLREYESGVIMDAERGRIVQNTRPFITKENNSEVRQRYIEKTRSALRAEISKAIYGEDKQLKPVSAFAAVAGELFRDIAANPEAHPRYRLETWAAIGKHAGLLEDGRGAQDTSNGGQGGALASIEAAARVLEIINQELERQKRDNNAIDGKIAG